MDITAPRPELWTRIAAFLGALRVFLRGVVTHKFDSVAATAGAHLIGAAALVRRYIHVLAADIALPPPAVGVSPQSSNETPNKLQRRRDTLFRLTELIDAINRASNSNGLDTPFVQWAMMMEAARRLALVLNHPEEHALRLARLLRRHARSTLKDLPVPASILKRLAPWTDALLCRLDEEARPQAWAGINAQAPLRDAVCHLPRFAGEDGGAA